MPLKSESTTRPNKWSRTNDGTTSKRTTRRSPNGQAAGPTNIKRLTNANIADPHHLVDSRLESIIEDLTLQSKRLQTTIIEFQNVMLNKLVIIRQHKLSSLRSSKPVTDPKPGKGLTDKNGEPKSVYPTAAGVNALWKPPQVSEMTRKWQQNLRPLTKTMKHGRQQCLTTPRK